MAAKLDDPRLLAPGCSALTPVAEMHANPWFTIRNRAGYFTTEYRLPQVIVLPVVEGNSVVMVQVKRPILADDTWELPAGSTEVGETAEDGARRELREETGITVPDSRPLEAMLPLSNSPNRNPNLLHIFQINLNRDEFDGRGAHDDEIHQVACFGFTDIFKMIASGKIYVSVPIAVIGKYVFEHHTDLIRS